MAKTLYRYRKFNGNLISMFINRELYFAIPETLNDPYDCQLPIIESINYLISTKIQKSVAMPQFSFLFGLKHIPA
jgi:hypothetical protein